MQYSLLVFEIVFYNPCNITGGVYKEVGEWEESEGGWASQRRVLPTIRAQTVVLYSQWVTEMYTIHRIDQGSHWQQFGIPPILISAPQWPHRACNAPMRFYRVSKNVCESRPGYLYLRSWCFWMVHECINNIKL